MGIGCVDTFTFILRDPVTIITVADKGILILGVSCRPKVFPE